MAVYTKINNKQIKFIERKYNIGKIENYSGIKKGIENTNFLLKTKKNKYILTIYEKRVQKKDLPFFVSLMSGLSRLKVKCPVPIDKIKGCNTIGISSGASAPEILVEKFIAELKDQFTVNIEEVEIVKENITFKIPGKLN